MKAEKVDAELNIRIANQNNKKETSYADNFRASCNFKTTHLLGLNQENPEVIKPGLWSNGR